LRVGKETSAFLSTLDQRLFGGPETIFEFGMEHLPCDVRDYEVGFPNRYLTKTRRLGRPQKMTSLDWKSEAAATVIHPLLKGNG
jgi:hypothetical protein